MTLLRADALSTLEPGIPSGLRPGTLGNQLLNFWNYGKEKDRHGQDLD